MNLYLSENLGRERERGGRTSGLGEKNDTGGVTISYETRIENRVVQSSPLCIDDWTNGRQVARGNQLNVKAQLTKSHDWGTYTVERRISHHPLTTVN